MKQIILWDIGNVLLKPIHGKILNELFENRKRDISSEEFKEKSAEVLNESFEGNITLDETWRNLFEIVGLDENEEKAKLIKKVEVIRNEELINYIKRDIKTKYEVGIISDLSQIGYFIVANYYKDLLELCNQELIFISTITKKTKKKAKKEYFDDIMKKIKEKSVFIDDEISNIEESCKSGFDGILFEGDYSNWHDANKILINKIKERNEK